MALEQPNMDLLVPFDALPPQKAFKPKIYCKNFDHRDQLVEYLVLRPKTDILQTRLACTKCVQGPLSICSQDLSLLEDIAADPFNLLKFTKYQQNEYQQFSDLLHAFDFNFDENMIELKFNKMQEQIIYQLQQCKTIVLENLKEYSKCREGFEKIKQNLNNTFDFTNLHQKLIEFAQEGRNPSPKKWKSLNEALDKYVEQLHKKDSEEQKQLQNDLRQLKQTLSNSEQLLLHKHKIEEGIGAIEATIKEMSKVFQGKLFIQSELSDDYIQTVLERIDTKYKKFEEVNTIKSLYSSVYEGLNYRRIQEILGPVKQQQILFVFQTNSNLKFGAFVYSGQNQKHLLFSLTRKQIYPSKSGAPAQSDKKETTSVVSNVPPRTFATINQPNPKPGPAPLPSGPNNFSQPGKPSGPPQSVPTMQPSVIPQTGTQAGPASSQDGPFFFDQKADDNSVLFKFGGEDLVIMSNFSDCKSNLGVGFDISQYEIGDTKMHLANALNFQIVGLEIFRLS